MKVPFLDLSKQNAPFIEDFVADLRKILSSGRYVSGERVEIFETALAKKHDSNYAIACNSGTSALQIILQSQGIGPGDEVIVPAMTFIATAEAVIQCGATPVVADIDYTSRNLSVKATIEVLTEKSKAIIFVPLHGNMQGILETKKLALSEGMFFIADAAQAHGAVLDGNFLGNLADATSLSFYPGKNLGAIGEGGAILTNNPDIAESAKLIRSWGSKKKYEHSIRGGNYRMDEIQASFLMRKLEYLETFNLKRKTLSRIYLENLSDLPLALPAKDSSSVFHIFSVLSENRERLISHLSENQIETGIHYPHCIQDLPGWRHYFSNSSATPIAKDFSQKNISLPMSDHHEIEHIEYVCSKITDFFVNS